MKTKYFTIVSLILFLSVFIYCSIPEKRKKVQILTEYGKITIELYNETPLHRDNFIKLINDSFYSGLLFHRVIKNFVVQGGDPDSKNAQPGKLLGEGDLPYKIPAEFHPSLFHKKGVLAAARESDQVNPLKESSAAQFYLVQGKVFTEDELNKLEEKRNNTSYAKKAAELNDTVAAKKFMDNNRFRYPANQRKIYTTTGGTPHLDQNYTVFGEITEGIEVVDKIANLQTDNNDRPLQDIRFTIITIK